ncbi:MAG TPA: ABC transporter permease subunit [Natronosporangium sp.]
MLVPPVVVLAMLLAGWWAYAELSGVESIVLPHPGEVAAVFTDRPGFLLRHMAVTAAEAAAGFAIATAVGIAVGAVVSMSRHTTQGVMPWLYAWEALPKVALGPVVILWLGWGFAPKVMMAYLLSVGVITINTVTGFRRLPAELVELAASLAATRWQVFIRMRFWNGLPQIFTGLKIAASLALIGAVLGELLSATQGLGFVIRVTTVDTPLVYAALVLLAITSMLINSAVVGTELVALRWHRHTNH